MHRRLPQRHQERDEKSSPRIQIFVAVIAAIGLVVTALINRSTAITTTLKPIEATQTAEAKLTAAAALSGLSPTVRAETPVTVFTDPAAAPTNTAIPTSAVAQKMQTEQTGDAQIPYSEDLKDGEIIIGHGTKFREYDEAVFLIVGAGHFDFELRTGLWDKWINITPDLYDGLIKEQREALIRYGKYPIVVICDSSGCGQKVSITPVSQPYVQSQENFPAYPAPVSTPHVSLREGEWLVGTAVRFAARAYGCNTMDMTTNIPYTVFLIRGPIELDLEIDNGGWEKWANEFVFDKNVAESLLQPKRNEVMKHDNYPLVGYVECIIPPY